MKKVFIRLVCILAAASVLCIGAYADIRPKPSVAVRFSGYEGERYFVTLLSQMESYGPHSSVSDPYDEHADYSEADEDFDIFCAFVEYEDPDGYYFLQTFKDCSGNHRYSWSYYPPDEFKILIYFPDSGAFVSSEGLTTYAFDSYYRAEAGAQGTIKVAKSYEYVREGVSLGVRIVITFAIELGIALLFGFRSGRQIRFIAIVNAVTQIGLNIGLNIAGYHYGPWALILWFFVLEFAVFAIEAALYSVFLKKLADKPVPGWKPVIYALAANAASFAVGLPLALLLPALF